MKLSCLRRLSSSRDALWRPFSKAAPSAQSQRKVAIWVNNVNLHRSRSAFSFSQQNRIHTPGASPTEEAIVGDFEEGEDLGEDDSDFSDSDSAGPVIDTANTSWGQTALEATRKVLGGRDMEDLELYSFRAMPSRTLVDIRLDKLSDRYGSPMLEEIEAFSRSLYTELEAVLGEEKAGTIALEASSPGAERDVRIPEDLDRFKDLPMTVSYRLPGEGGNIDTKVLQVAEVDAAQEACVWQLANVRVNRPGGKGSKLTKKQSLQRIATPFADLVRVRLFIEI